MPPKIFVIQNGTMLIRLREEKRLTQQVLAENLTEHVRSYGLIKGYCLQQSNICRWESEKSAIGVVELLAYASYFNTDLKGLLKSSFGGKCHADLKMIKHNTHESAMQYLVELEKKGRVIVFSRFPSSPLASDESERSNQIMMTNYKTDEFYTVDGYLQFLFSPISRFSIDTKIEIIEKYINLFNNKNANKRIYFFSRHHYKVAARFPNFELLNDNSIMIMIAPLLMKEGEALLEIHDTAICEEAYKDYFTIVPKLNNSQKFLKAGLKALRDLKNGESHNISIKNFCDFLDTDDRSEVTPNISPDIVEYLKL